MTTGTSTTHHGTRIASRSLRRLGQLPYRPLFHEEGIVSARSLGKDLFVSKMAVARNLLELIFIVSGDRATDHGSPAAESLGLLRVLIPSCLGVEGFCLGNEIPDRNSADDSAVKQVHDEKRTLVVSRWMAD